MRGTQVPSAKSTGRKQQHRCSSVLMAEETTAAEYNLHELFWSPYLFWCFDVWEQFGVKE